MESTYNAAVAIASAIRGTPGKKLYHELDFVKDDGRENSTTFSKYLIVILPNIFSKYFLALAKHIIQELIITFPSSVLNIICFSNFLPSTFIEWNNLEFKIRSSESLSAFKKSILKL